jgi:dephospho-CoA kinase
MRACAPHWKAHCLGQNKPFVIGLTGSIGMGKSETAKLFAGEGIPVFDADRVVHALYAGEASAMIEAAFPGSTKNGVVDRAALARQVTGDAQALGRLESLMHPLVAERRAQFLEETEAPIVLLDIPLLLETGIKSDAVVVATAPADVQRQRVLARPGMTQAKFEALLARQMSDAQKRAQADYLVTTDKGLEDAREQVKMILADVRAKIQNA